MKLKRPFYLRNPLEVARDLIKKELVHITDEGKLGGRIVEVEAYGGVEDLACHSLGGKKTDRNKLLYKKGGYIYIYLIYGMYYCFNVVTGRVGEPGAVFIRAVEPLQGIELMKKNRIIKIAQDKDVVKLTNGPGKLCEAMKFDKSCYGVNLCGGQVFIDGNEVVSDEEIKYTSRINIDYAGEAKKYLWRIVLKKSQFLSR